MPVAAFFGHKTFDYHAYTEKIEAIVVDLIENYGVTEFYNGFRGAFDRLCAEVVSKIQVRYPTVKNIMALSYHPKEHFRLPDCFHESVYLLEKCVPPKFAIFYTNRAIIEKADIIISGVYLHTGGAWSVERLRIRNTAKKNRIEHI